MIKELLSQKGISLYKMSKETGIPYSTLNDLVVGKTLIENVSSKTLHILSKYFELTMEELYMGDVSKDVVFISNEGRNVIIKYKENVIRYLGPKNLVEFSRINKVTGGVVYVDTLFKQKNKYETEEDYIDLIDIFDEYKIDFNRKHFPDVMLEEPKISKERIIDKALMVSDYMAICPFKNSSEKIELNVFNLNRIHLQMKLRLSDYAILSTNMSKNMQNRAVETVMRNESLLYEMLKEDMYA